MQNPEIQKRELTEDQKIKLIETALQTPTADNCQPFRFRWVSDQELEVFYMPSLGKHFLNADNMTTYLSMGALLESLMIRARDWGKHLTWKLGTISSEAEPQRIASIQFSNSSEQKDYLSSFVMNRHTDRRTFRNTALPEVFWERAKINEQLIEGPSSHFWQRKSTPMVDHIAGLDSLIWTTEEAHQDLSRWLRISKKELQQKDGMPWQTLGISKAEKSILQLGRNWQVQRLLNLFGMPAISRNVLKKQIHSSSYLMLISVTGTGLDALIEAGRLSLRHWVLLNQFGFGVQPLSLSSFLIYLNKTQRLHQEVKEKYGTLIHAAQQSFAESFDLKENQIPVWLFRTGDTSHLPPAPRAPRIDWKDALL